MRLTITYFIKSNLTLQIRNEIQDSMSDNNYTINQTSYSTIFHCKEDATVCFLRVLEGIISAVISFLFIRGYQAIMRVRNNPITQEDKSIYMLSMAQTVILTLYYLLFEQFFVLATIRNLLIWISINMLEVLSKIYFLNDDLLQSRFGNGLNLLRVVNFFTWFWIAIDHGSSITNSNFNLGYNCNIMDWVILSGILLVLTTLQGYFAFMIKDKLDWEENNTNDKLKLESIREQRTTILLLVGASMAGAFIMFLWDYFAYVSSNSDNDCVEIFSGNTFFRKVLCFILKLISMQSVTCLVYYSIYYIRFRNIGGSVEGSPTRVDPNNYDPDRILRGSQYSFLNENLLSSRSSSQRDLESTIR